MKIEFRAVIEVLGRPKEHVEESLQGYLKKLGEDKNFTITHKEIAPIKEQDELWSIFAEVEATTQEPQHLTNFCFEYMPSVIEVLKPAKLSLTEEHLSSFFSDLQARLHQVDMLAKQTKMENDHLKRNMNSLLKNYITILLQKRPLSAKELSNLTGVPQDRLEEFLDYLIDKGVINQDGSNYTVKEKAVS